jgi:cytochrome c2
MQTFRKIKGHPMKSKAGTPERRVVRSLMPILLSILVSSFAAPTRADSSEPVQLFNRRCTSCHTYGKGIRVGPDLKGVTERRQRPWLLKFIRSSQGVIKSGDAVARGLFQQFKQQRMPDWTDLSDRQIAALLDWIASGCPDVKEANERNAELATPPEIERGRALFHGVASLANHGLACVTCHAIRDDGATAGGSLGPNLTAVYTRYQDRALTLFLKRPCFRRVPESATPNYLMPEESFAIKAYLRRAALQSLSASLPASSGGGGINHDRQSGGTP